MSDTAKSKCIFIPEFLVGKLVFEWKYAEGTQRGDFDKFVDIYPIGASKPIMKCHQHHIIKLSPKRLATDRSLIQDYEFSMDVFKEEGNNTPVTKQLSEIMFLTVYNNEQ